MVDSLKHKVDHLESKLEKVCTDSLLIIAAVLVSISVLPMLYVKLTGDKYSSVGK